MDKIHRYEEFVDRRLKPDLANAMAERAKVLEQQKVFSDLKKNILMLEKNGLTQLRTMVNLGSEVYVQAEVWINEMVLIWTSFEHTLKSCTRPDTRHIFVEIGLGFHVEFTWSEALQFISTKETVLDRQVKDYTEQIAKIKAQIKLVCEGIRELLNLPADSLRQTRKY